MNNCEAHITTTTLPGIPRLENLEKASPNIYSNPAQLGRDVSGACAADFSPPLKGGFLTNPDGGFCTDSCAVENDDIDNLKNMKATNNPYTNYSNSETKATNISRERNTNIYVPMDPPEEAVYTEPNIAGYAEPNIAGYAEPNSTPLNNYLPMNGSRSNILDVVVNPGSSSTINSDGVGFPYDVPKSSNGTYDVPKPEHIYSEIPEAEPHENVYEALDEIRQKREVAGSSESSI